MKNCVTGVISEAGACSKHGRRAFATVDPCERSDIGVLPGRIVPNAPDVLLFLFRPAIFEKTVYM